MQATDADNIRKMVALAESGKIPAAELAQALDKLAEYECWGPYFKLIKRQLEDPRARVPADFIKLARVQNLYLEDVFAAADTCANLVEALDYSFQRFTEEALPQVIEFEDWAAEATILSATVGRFRKEEDHVACLERLCMLYEKKTHNETQLTKSYEKLLAVDPRNVKALRYFKLVFTQSNEWEEVVGILKTLLATVTRPQEIFRYAQELAAIFLYQLDMAEEAIAAIEANCEGTPLDTSTILFDAYHRLGDWPGCLRVLRGCLLNVDDDRGRAILHIKIAGLHEQIGEFVEAQENFVRAAQLEPGNLDAIEGVIGAAVQRKEWPVVVKWLQELTSRVHDEKQVSQLKQAIKRLQDGLEHAPRA